ncbi:MAG: HAD-IIIA family hydrolase [Candidatus Peregrinibacteria bacterium]
MKFLLIDFDGTLIENNEGVAYDPATLTLLSGVVEGLQRLRDAGMRFFITSNQSKIARGISTEENVRAAFDHIIHILKEQGITIEAGRWCPHCPEDNCGCRKPKTGLWEMLRTSFPELVANETAMVGDQDKDVLFGQEIGCQTARIFSSQRPRITTPTFVIRSFVELADILLVPADRLLPLPKAVVFSEKEHAQGHTIVTTNGAFDLFHAGHQFLLEEARKQGDVLIVGINSDTSVRRQKGEGRPIQSAETRMRNVARFADAVFIFDEDDPRSWLPQIKPDVHVNAAIYGEQCVERSILDDLGAKLVLVPMKKELGSTTQHLSNSSSPSS